MPPAQPDGQAHGAVARGAAILAIVVAAAAGLLDTVPDFPATFRQAIEWAAAGAFVAFTVEYAARLWTAADRRTYAVSFLGIIDLLVFVPVLLHAAGLAGAIAMDLAGLLSLVKLARYLPGLPLVVAVFRNEARSLLAAASVLGVLLMLSSGIMFVLERDAQPTVFTSIPKTLWWGIVTIASVGYGDMTPVTPLGRLFGGMVILLGIAVFAVPAGILATGFAAELRKQDFIVSWQSVARVPLFAALDANTIAEIARLLHAQQTPPNYLIVRRGDAADAMYFIQSGEVEVEVAPPVRLRAGQFFGEIGLLNDVARTASVSAVTECQLLRLDVDDFRRLMERYRDLAAAIRRVADSRAAKA